MQKSSQLPWSPVLKEERKELPLPLPALITTLESCHSGWDQGKGVDALLSPNLQRASRGPWIPAA